MNSYESRLTQWKLSSRSKLEPIYIYTYLNTLALLVTLRREIVLIPFSGKYLKTFPLDVKYVVFLHIFARGDIFCESHPI